MQKISFCFILVIIVYNCSKKENNFDKKFYRITNEISNFYYKGLEMESSKTNLNIDDLEGTSFFVTDYPLVDIPIRYNDSKISLIISNNILIPNKSEYFLIEDKGLLEKMQCTFNITTFPKGLGTTPDSYVYVYQNNILIKEIPFLDTYDNKEYNLTNYTKEELELYLKIKLPIPF